MREDTFTKEAILTKIMRTIYKMENEKYLSIKIAGHNYINAFKNKDKTGNQPDYKGDGVAVWISDRKPKEQTKPKEETVL
jgi:hypothetical protein